LETPDEGAGRKKADNTTDDGIKKSVVQQDNRYGAGRRGQDEDKVEENDFIVDNPPTPPPRIPNKGLQEDMEQADEEYELNKKKLQGGKLGDHNYRTNQIRQAPNLIRNQQDNQSIGPGSIDAITRVNDPMEIKS